MLSCLMSKCTFVMYAITNINMKKILQRHEKEKHRNLEYWNCVVSGCKATFIRRDYLSIHLNNVHKSSKLNARQAAVKAVRGNTKAEGYYYKTSVRTTQFSTSSRILIPMKKLEMILQIRLWRIWITLRILKSW